MKWKSWYGWAIAITLFIGIIWFLVHFQEDYTIRGVCKDKVYTGDKYGDVHYYVIIQYENGDSFEESVSAGGYASYTIGTTYIFTRQRFTWNPKK